MNYKKELNNIYNKLVQKAQLGLKVQSYSDGSVENGANKDIYNTPSCFNLKINFFQSLSFKHLNVFSLFL